MDERITRADVAEEIARLQEAASRYPALLPLVPVDFTPPPELPDE